MPVLKMLNLLLFHIIKIILFAPTINNKTAMPAVIIPKKITGMEIFLSSPKRKEAIEPVQAPVMGKGTSHQNKKSPVTKLFYFFLSSFSGPFKKPIKKIPKKLAFH